LVLVSQWFRRTPSPDPRLLIFLVPLLGLTPTRFLFIQVRDRQLFFSGGCHKSGATRRTAHLSSEQIVRHAQLSLTIRALGLIHLCSSYRCLAMLPRTPTAMITA
jgi:hypothetical protein